jgi:hypothetical protein
MTKEIAFYGLGAIGSAALGFLGGWLYKGHKVKKLLKASEVTFQQLQAVIASNRKLNADHKALIEEVGILKARVAEAQTS